MATNTRTGSRTANRDKATTADASTDASTDAPDTTTPATTPDSTATPDGPDTATPDATGPDGDQRDDAGQDDAGQDDPEQEIPVREWIDVVRLLAMQTAPTPTAEESQSAPLLWEMLSAAPDGMTAGQMYESDDLPVIETSTIKAVMGRYERVGMVRSEGEGKRQRWIMGTASEAYAAIEAMTSRPRTGRTSAMTVSATVSAPSATPEGHWPNGELKATVAAFLHANPHESFTATEICRGTGIVVEKHGSVTHALGALVKDGEIVIASEGPKRWQSALNA